MTDLSINQIDQEFEKETRALSVQRIKIICLLAVPFFPAFSILDYYVAPQNYRFFLLLRLISAAINLAVLIVCFLKFSKRHVYLLGVLSVLPMSFFISVMTQYTGGHTSTYYAGLNLMFLGFSLLMPWSLKRTAGVYVAIYLSYIVPIFLFEKTNNMALFLNNNFFLVMTMIIAATATYFSHKLRFREFMSRITLENTNASLKETKDNLEKAYTQLKELDAIKTRFFANVSHELRTPLTLIMAPIESMLKGEIGKLGPAQAGHVQIMYQNALRLLKMINNLLDLAKIDAGKMQLNLESVNMGEYVKGIVASVSPMADKKQIRLSFAGNGPLDVVCDKEKVERILLNLVFNSLKFTDAGGSVTVRCQRTRAEEADDQALRATISVTDTGIGFGKEFHTKIFERFSQVDATASRKYEGSGIGLSLAKELVELHGGRIWADSAPGKGTVMTFTLPMNLKLPETEQSTDDHRAARRRARDRREGERRREEDWTRALHIAAEYSAADVLNEPGAKTGSAIPPSGPLEHKILLIEDNSDMRSFIAFQLQGAFDLIQARNGIEGLEMANRDRPDLIISDVMMPGKDGYEVCREIKNNPHTKHIPVILLTAKAELSEKISGLEYGADDYLTKPFNAQELKAKIRSLIQLRGLEREIQHRSEELERTLKMLQDTQTQLVHSEKMAALGLLVAGIAHEVNNPVSFAKGSLSNLRRYLGQVRDALEQRPETRQVLEQFNVLLQDIEQSLNIVKAGLDRTEGIVIDLKTFARKDDRHTRRVDIQEGLEATLKLIQHEMGGRITLHRDYGIRDTVEIIPGQINQVFMNLFQNAIHAIPGKGDIWVRSWEDGDWVHVSVRDSGAGIRKEHLGRIFEPFFTTKEIGQGTGLGLSVSCRIVEGHGGKLTVSSEEGRGAEFVITLPKRQSQGGPPSATTPAESVSVKGNIE
jgi:signal transduction histidine kinase